MKSHFQFSKNERNGIFLLVIVILILQAFLWFHDSASESGIIQSKEVREWQNEIDSLKRIHLANNLPKIYPFNPNFITDYKGYTLGMTNEEIDRLHQYRSKNQWINSAKQFQEITQISDSLLANVSPYFKFPDWVTNHSLSTKTRSSNYSKTKKPKTFNEKVDLNRATMVQLQKVHGIGEKLSARILAYRNKFEGGFHSDIELSEVYGLSPEVISRILEDFTVKTPRPIKTLDLNLATRDELVTIQYIDYEIANNIIEVRTLHEGFNSIDELTKVEQFPVNKLHIIRLYLHL